MLSVVSHAFSSLCMYSKFGHHPCPLAYLCAKLRFCRGLCCCASPWRKIAYSINHSLNHPAYLMHREPKLCFGTKSNDQIIRVMWLLLPRSKAQLHICFPVHGTPWWELLEHSIMLRLFFIVECGITCFLNALYVFKVRASSSSPRQPYAKFHFVQGLHCWASPLRKIAYSLTHSLTELIPMPREPKCLCFGTTQNLNDTYK